MTGARTILTCLAGLSLLLGTVARAVAISDESIPIVFDRAVDNRPAVTVRLAASRDDQALDEMLRGSRGQVQRWSRSPDLVILGAVMRYTTGEGADYFATEEKLTEAEIDQMVADLTRSLALLTGNRFESFSSIKREWPRPGQHTRVTRQNQVVVGRYEGVRRELNTIGLGGRASRPDGTITAAAILLDDDFDRTSSLRRLLRMHELGHALGYNHVQSQISIMNPRIGPEPTEFDRRAAAVAFRR
jgi:hypothetical protein